MRIVSEEQVQRLLDPGQVIAAIEDAFRHHYQLASAPTRLQQSLGERGVLLLMPCYDPLYRAAGVKMVTVDAARASGRDRVQATYALLDLESGQPELLIAANYLTDLRTAATSALATRYLARKESAVLGIFGTGRQARAHAIVLSERLPLKKILVCGSSPQRSEEFVRQMSAEMAVPLQAAEASACASQSDVICTCTTARSPLFAGELLRPGTHLNLVGSFQPNVREVDEVAVSHARIVVDTYDGALAEAGDLIVPLETRVIGREHLLADLHELISGRQVRNSESDITMFKSVGCALEDLAVAVLLRRKLPG